MEGACQIEEERGGENMINRIALANALTAAVMSAYLVCSVVSIIAPTFIMGLAQSWLHTINIELIETTSPVTFGSFLLGFFSLGLLTWVASYFTVTLYNNFAHGEVRLFREHRGYVTG